jgi:TatD DNase family protein
MYIDTHCHLNFPEFNSDRNMVIGNAKKVGVKLFINPGNSIITSQQAVQLTTTYPGVVFAAVGVHPYEVNNLPDISQIENLLTHQPAKPTIVAIGECGLDYHVYKDFPAAGKKTEQKLLFENQLYLALKYDLPVIIHCREAFSDTFDVLDSLPAMPRGVFHCFSGGLEDVRNIQSRHFFLGLDGNTTYSKQLKAVIPSIPLSMILLETDSPLLPPEGHRGERNEPKYLPQTAHTIAELSQQPIEVIQAETTKNAQSLFHIGI